jgi:predicted ABC-type ATPase
MSEVPSTLRVIIIAGPNGAGKTTFAREFLPHEADCPVFVNADLIAAGLAPFAPESVAVQAGRLMLQEISADAAVARVAQRVRQGGHHVADDLVRRRFASGRSNFERLYAPAVDAWALYDNAGAQPILLDWSDKA